MILTITFRKRTGSLANEMDAWLSAIRVGLSVVPPFEVSFGSC